ncbi:MAG: hypothetical protein R8N23_06240 [Reichenbachiella sp.]|uniref:hypothetical protein n=1 Tax=Reichenbachiella sp. TaxID=2184521 RepID=UPI0029666760|nr:hypothetical protein [Reichenbachiella sp.]MDW3209446.1 hypothetical protein [Reichenbachiella sp.]
MKSCPTNRIIKKVWLTTEGGASSGVCEKNHSSDNSERTPTAHTADLGLNCDRAEVGAPSFDT